MTVLITLNANGLLLIQTVRKSLASSQEGWIPDRKAKYILRVIVDILEKTGLKLQLSESLKEEILVASIPVSNKPSLFICIDFQPNKTSKFLRLETVH